MMGEGAVPGFGSVLFFSLYSASLQLGMLLLVGSGWLELRPQRVCSFASDELALLPLHHVLPHLRHLLGQLRRQHQLYDPGKL